MNMKNGLIKKMKELEEAGASVKERSTYMKVQVQKEIDDLTVKVCEMKVDIHNIKDVDTPFAEDTRASLQICIDSFNERVEGLNKVIWLLNKAIDAESKV